MENPELKIWVDRFMKSHRINDGCLICRLVKAIESLEAKLLNETECHQEWKLMAENLSTEIETMKKGDCTIRT